MSNRKVHSKSLIIMKVIGDDNYKEYLGILDSIYVIFQTDFSNPLYMIYNSDT